MNPDAAARQRALELAIDNASNGTTWPVIIDVAKQFSDFIIAGKTPDPK